MTAMIDLINFVVGVVAAFILGLAAHSVYDHTKRRGELPDLPWDHKEEIEG